MDNGRQVYYTLQENTHYRYLKCCIVLNLVDNSKMKMFVFQVESLKGSGNLNFDEVKLENENFRQIIEDTDSDSPSPSPSEDEAYDDLHPE